MQIRKRNEQDVAVLLDWGKIDHLWVRSTFHPLDRELLIDAYSEQWFLREGDQVTFTVAEIGLNTDDDAILFCNGRNRTNLIYKHQPYIPVSFPDGIPCHKEIQGAIIKVLETGDAVELPDLPVLSVTKLRELAGEK
ncbi:hypothetical protein [Mariprofundus ferrooxydans]|uniref:hypothetical protein n=1 Tax=Mariprofundus ferrooxydans TaxID=314344 RepID=UPI00128AF8E0|nr:hypothetical protein [Mariprofundus ferrooxydans]